MGRDGWERGFRTPPISDMPHAGVCLDPEFNHSASYARVVTTRNSGRDASVPERQNSRATHLSSGTAAIRLAAAGNVGRQPAHRCTCNIGVVPF